MKLDDEDQRTMLLQILGMMTFQGSAIDQIMALKTAIVEAGIEN